jgi:hypothetical protein
MRFVGSAAHNHMRRHRKRDETQVLGFHKFVALDAMARVWCTLRGRNGNEACLFAQLKRRRPKR